MGCVASEDGFDEALSQDLENQMNYNSVDKHDKEVDRFQSNKPEEGFDDFFATADESDEQFMAVKPWIGALVAPSEKPQFVREQPDHHLNLEFINGFKIEDSRQNMFWGKNQGQIIYPAAAVGVVMNVNSLKQRYMGAGLKSQVNGHTDDIISLGVCPERKLVVTGSLGARPDILVWDSETMEVLYRTKLGRNTRAVSTIRFSKDGKYFFCSDKHNDSNVYCYKTEGAERVGQNKCGSDAIFDAQAGNNNTYAVGTKRGMWFFEFTGSELDKKKGIFSGHPMNTMITVAYSSEGNCFYSGSSKGDIYQWHGNTCSKHLRVHSGSVRGLQCSNGLLLSSGSKDKSLKVSKNFEIIHEFQLPSYALSLDYHHGFFLAATGCGKIITINEQTKESKTIMQGHSQGQTWGLAIGPNGNVYSTADDNQIISFNPKSFKVDQIGTVSEKKGRRFRIGGASTLSRLPPNQHSRAVAVSGKGLVVIGTNDGTLSVRRLSVKKQIYLQNLNETVFEQKIAKEWIEVLKFSPAEDKLAVGSHDNNIYIFKVEGESLDKIATCKAHNSFITNLDWSCDGSYIQSNCGAYEYLFFDANSGSQLKSGASQLRNQAWATYTVKLGWWVQGIFPRAKSGDHVNGVDRSHAKDVIATADDWGFVNLYRNPALKGAKCKSYRAHSSHVVRVMFDPQDQFVYTVGGYDKTLMMWKYQ